MRRAGAAARRLVPGAAALAGLLALCAPLSAAGRKAGGATEVVDDLTTGLAGSVGLAGGGFTLDGSLGQTAAGIAENVTDPKPAAEAGYFSRGVTAPASASFQVPPDPYSSINVDWSLAENAAGTLYTVELSTASDFTGVVHSTRVFVQAGSVVFRGLRSGAFYWGRIKASYMEGDESGYRMINGGGTPTQLYCGSISSREGQWDWTDPAAWDVPGFDDFPPTPCSDVGIVAKSSVTMNDADGRARSVDIALGGAVFFSTTTSSRLELMDGSFTVNNGAVLEMGAPSAPVLDGVRAELVLATGTAASRKGLKIFNGGRFTVHGATKTPFSRTDQDIGPGQTSFLLAEDPSALNWRKGDRIVVGPGELSGTAAVEEVTIDSIAGTIVNVVPSFSKTFKTTTTVHVANLTRNVVVRSSGTDIFSDTSFVRSFVTVQADLDIRYAEFAYLGAAGGPFGEEGVALVGPSAQAWVSSSSFHHGYYGLLADQADALLVEESVFYGNELGLELFSAVPASILGNHAAGNQFEGIRVGGGGGAGTVDISSNAAYANDWQGINIDGLNAGFVAYNELAANGFSGLRIGGFSGNVLQENLARSNGQHGFLVEQGADGNDFFANIAASNTFAGIYVSTVFGGHFRDNEAFRNGAAGMVLQGAATNFFWITDLYENAGPGLLTIGADRNYFAEIYAYQNGAAGLRLEDGSDENAFSEGAVGGNGSGIELDSVRKNRLAGLRVYNNGGLGLSSRRSADNVFDAGRLGYDMEGLDAPNGGAAEVSLGPAEGLGGFLELMSSRVHDTPEIDVASLNESSKAVISWNQDFATGTLRLWGHAVLENEGVAFDFAAPLQVSTASFPVLLRGTGHFLEICSIDDGAAVSQIVHVVREGTDWNVFGSSSGFMGQNPTNVCPGTDYGQFRLALSVGGGPEEGDRLAFVLRAGTKDQNRQKQVLFGPADPDFNGGRSKIETEETVSWTLRGVPGQPTIMDRLDPGGTYYSFVASGTFQAEHAEIRNLEPNGLYIVGPSARLVLSSSTFDGLSDAGAVNAYITAADLPLAPSATFYGVTFGDSRSVAASSVNVRVLGGAGVGPDWTFRRWSGPMGGEDRDDDGPGGEDRIKWSPFTPLSGSLVAMFESSATFQWQDGVNDAGVRYNLEASEGGSFSTIAASSNTASSTATATGLAANTTHHFRVSSVEVGTSPPLGLGEHSTLAKAPEVLPATFPEVGETTATVAWAARPSAPLSESAEGYLLEASSSPTFSFGVVSTGTTNVALSTLTVGLSPALDRNTTYYFRVASLNWIGTPNYTLLGATSTLALPTALFNPPFAGVFATSATARWLLLPETDQGSSCEGFRLEASTAADFTGIVLSSATSSPAQAALTVSGLTPYVTYYFRVGTLNWNGVPNYSVSAATVPRRFFPKEIPVDAGLSAFGAAWGDDDNDGDLDLILAVDDGTARSYGVRNGGAGAFSTFTVVNGPDLTRAAAWGDFDGDGDLDLALARVGIDVRIMRKVGSSFTTAQVITPDLTQDNARAVAWGDYDNDGDLDLAVGVDDTGEDYIARNDGAGIFSTITLAGSDLGTQALAWGDFDNDGDLDLAAAKDNGTAVEQRVYRNDGGSFVPMSLGASFTGRGRGVAWGDFDGDSDLDLVFAVEDGNTLFFRNNGGASFSGSAVPGTGAGGQAVAAADFDGDGDLDAALARDGGRESLLLVNDGTGSFQVVPLLGTAGESRGIVWGDFDDDGDLDLALALAGSRKDLLLDNAVQTADQRPAKVPLSAADLSFDYGVSGSTLTVRWDAGSYDAEGGSHTVTYSVAAATVPMSHPSGDELRLVSSNGFVVPPQFGSPLQGHHLRPAYDSGTGKHRVSFLVDQPGGRFRSDQTYYIRVQAMDGGLRRSSWSVEISTYVFADLPPQGRTISEVFLSSLTVSYASVPGGSAFLLEASTAADFTGQIVRSSATDSAMALLPAEGLGANTTYYLRMGTLYRQTTSYALTVPASTATLAMKPSTPLFASVSSGAAVASWSANGNPGGTLYEAYLSTGTPFSVTDAFTRFAATVSYDAAPSVSFGELEANTTYYLTVNAVNHNGLRTATIEGSTVTRITPPTEVFFDRVSSDTIVASAYAPTPAFRNLDKGLSGTQLLCAAGGAGCVVGPWQRQRWTAKGSLPAERRSGAAAVLEGSLYVFGGEDSGGVDYNSTLVFSTGTGQWTSLAGTLSVARSLSGAAGLGGRVYAFGGTTGSLVRTHDRYDPSSDAWVTRLDMPAPSRASVGGAAVAGRVHAVGGQSATLETGDHDAYDPATNSWIALSETGLTARDGPAAVAAFEKLYVIGGKKLDESQFYGVVEAYDPANDGAGWSPKSAMPAPRERPVAALVGGKIYVLGGRDGSNSGNNSLAANEEYDPRANVWAERLQMPLERTNAMGGAVDGRIYVAGGERWTGTFNTLSDTYEFDPGVATVFTGLAPNTSYGFRAKARNSLGAETDTTSVFSTHTLAAVPGSAIPSFTGVFPTSVTVAWIHNGNPGGTEYRVEASTAADFTGDMVAADWDAYFGTTSTDVVSLAANTTYYFQVRARNARNLETANLVLGSTVTAVNPPASPAAGFVSADAVELEWDANGNAGGTLYEAEISSVAGFDPLWASTQTTSTAAFFGAGGEPPALVANTTYYLRVRAFNRAGTPTDYSASVATLTLVNMPAPHAASSYTSVGVFVLTARWDANGNPGDTDYIAELSTDGYVTINVSSRTKEARATFGLGGAGASLLANTTYTVRVAALNRAGSATAVLDLGEKATLAGQPNPVPEPFPAVSDAGLSVAWNVGVNPPETLFEAQISTDGFATVNLASQTLNAQAAFGQGGEGEPLDANTTYFVSVHAINKEMIPTGAIFDSTITLPAQPLADTFMVGVSSVDVAWLANGNPAGTEYEALSSSDGFASVTHSSFTRNLSVLFGTGGEAPPLTPNTTYSFRVRGVGWAGARGSFMTQVDAPTLAEAPSGEVLQAVEKSSIAFDWSGGLNPAGTLYEAELSTDGFATLNLASRTLDTESLFGAGGEGADLEANATYYARVRAVNHGGTPTDYTVALETATPAAVPAGLQAPSAALDSVLLQWDGQGNRAGTRYRAEISDDNFSSVADSSDTAELSVLFGTGGHGAALAPNTTYHFRVFAIDLLGRDVGPSAEVSTVTLVAQPLVLSPPFLSTDVSSITFHWDPNGNPADTLYRAEISSDGFASFVQSSFTRNTSALFGAGGEPPDLERNTTYYLRVSALNRVGAPTAPTAVQSTMTLVDVPLLPADPFPRVDFNAVRFEWSPNGNLPGTVYRVDMATSADFTTVDRSSVTVSTSALLGKNGLTPNLLGANTYYFRVRAFNGRGVATPFTVVRDTVTPPGDLIPPTAVDNQPGDDVWRSFNGGVYDVDFFDTGGADLDRFAVRISTVAGGGGPAIVESSNVVTNINADNYTADWALPLDLFNKMTDGVTNYVTVLVFDGNANSHVQAAFHVLKDVAAPAFVNGEAGGDLAGRSAAGTTYDVDVLDPASGIAAFEYSASTDAGTGNQAVIPWTAIALPGGATQYTADWAVDWSALVPNATNYISIRAWDLAGTTNQVTDAFFVLKDTEPPTVGLTVPSSDRSQLVTISGTAADSLNVQGAELKFKEAGGNHWDGSGFLSLSEQWFPAAGTIAWSLSPGIPWQDGRTYQVVARASDTAGQFSPAYSTQTFLFDASTPTAVIFSPPNATISSLSSIFGTAADPDPDGGGPLGFSGLADVEVRLRRESDGRWWNWVTETWGAVPVSSAAALSGINWDVTPSELLKANLAHLTSYFVTVSASDNATPRNQELFEVIGATFTFSDTTPPAAVTNLSALQGPSPGQIELSWTAPGDDGTDGIILLGEYRVQHATFAGVAFSTGDAQIQLATATVRPGETHGLLLSSLSAGVTYYLSLWTQDDAGNWSPISNGATVQATPQPSDRIEGHVMKVSSEGITAVLMEAFDGDGTLVSSSFSLADGSGTYALTGLTSGVYRVQATWTADEVSSSVWLDGIPLGQTGVDFILELNYTLSTLQGTLQTLAGGGGGGGSAFLAQASANQFQGSVIELYQKDRRVATATVGPDGRWTISNLLPGKYAVRAFNGYEYTQLQQIALGEGEVREVGFVFDPLPEEAVFAFPNPAKDSVTFRFVSALSPLEAQILIFDIAGTLVREIAGSELVSPSPGLYHAGWDLTNGRGEDVASGVYLFLVKVKGGNGQNAKVIKKLAVVR